MTRAQCLLLLSLINCTSSLKILVFPLAMYLNSRTRNLVQMSELLATLDGHEVHVLLGKDVAASLELNRTSAFIHEKRETSHPMYESMPKSSVFLHKGATLITKQSMELCEDLMADSESMKRLQEAQFDLVSWHLMKKHCLTQTR